MNGYGIHQIRDIYGPNVSAGLEDGRWVIAVPEPRPCNCLMAAWAVLTGRAVALEWPKAGDLEKSLGWDTPERQRSSR